MQQRKALVSDQPYGLSRWVGWTPVSTFLLAILAFGAVQAEEPMSDKFKIALGGYGLTRYDTSISLTEANSGLGVAIRPEDLLAVETQRAVLRLDGHYKFNDHHALTYSWYRISSDGTRSIDTEIDWIDQDGNPIVIPIGAAVDTSLDFDIYKLGYLWTFYNSDKVELAVGAGLHISRIGVGLTAEATGNDLNAKQVKSTVPLPVLTLAVGYNIAPKWDWYLKSEFFALSFEDWDGVYTDTSLALEYGIAKNVALGLGLGSNSLRVVEDTSAYRFAFENRISGVLLYVAAKF